VTVPVTLREVSITIFNNSTSARLNLKPYSISGRPFGLGYTLDSSLLTRRTPVSGALTSHDSEDNPISSRISNLTRTNTSIRVAIACDSESAPDPFINILRQ
jgi:hypothetical protein